MRQNKKQNGLTIGLIYYVLILLSVLDILGIVFCVYKTLISFTSSVGSSLNLVNKGNGPAQPNPYMWLVLFFACLILFPVLTTLRQKYRDLYEYDEKGNSKRFGKPSQLSAKERKALDIQKLADQERILSSSTRKKITHEGPKDCEKELKKLVGLLEVKQDVHEMESRMIYEQNRYKETHRHGKFKPTTAQHMIFYGPPGTGKTTIARIMTRILYKNGYIRKNQCVEIDGNFFLGLSEGESIKRTRILLEHALGGVLFIDEAYSLAYSYAGRSILASIVKEMEDNQSDLVVILAGYDDEMKKLLDLNPGLRSRIKKFLNFKSYSVEELKQIFLCMANQQGFCVDISLLDKFEDYIAKERSAKDFGNARSVRNLLDLAIDKHAANLMDGKLSQDAKYMLSGIDMPDVKEKML